MRLLVTGGAGYIGSHVVRALLRAHHDVHVVDDLSNGHAENVRELPFTRADVTTPGLVRGLAEQLGAQGILHFAARIQVGESVARPELYYQTNVGGMIAVATTARDLRIPVVFSSTAAVYGEPESTPIPTSHPCRPESPYGASKHMGERILADCARAGGFGYAILRYFNAAGADVAAGLREQHSPETHLVPLAIDAARSGQPLKVFGNDWPTPDGTCLRDYVHVVDLADAHVRALDAIAGGGVPSLCVNLGGGEGTSVTQVLLAVGHAVGKPVPVIQSPRRDGDVARLVADISEARRVLGWSPRRSSIAEIVGDATAVR